MIKLCYKEYDYKVSLEAAKKFFDKTGLDLQIVLAKYIECNHLKGQQTLLSRMISLGSLYTRDIVNHALHSTIKPCHKEVSFEEICDATFRVGWQLSERPDDLSEPYPIIMLALALEYNDYCNANIPGSKKKEEATSD